MSGSRPNLREAWTFLAGGVKLALVVSMVPVVLAGNVIECTLIEILPNVPIKFRVDGLGILFALVASTLWLATSLYSIGYMRALKEHAQTRFFVFFAVALSATLGVAFSANLVTLYLFYEILSLATYPLVTHHQDREARGGGRTYLTYLLGTSIGFALPAMIYAYYKSGGMMDFSTGGFLAGKVNGVETLFLLPMFIFGFSKAGLMPFHSWLPGAMVAPTPVSALLHAVAVVKVGVFCVLRIFTGVFGGEFLGTMPGDEVILWVGAFTILTASLIALSQDNLKRRLAFSTISQLAYIVVGAALLTPRGLTGGMIHIGMHAFGKITLFFCAGAIFVATGKKYVSEMAGLGRRMPVTMTAFLFGALSTIGLPPFGGAWSKWYLMLGALDAKHFFLVVVLMISSLLNIAYLLPVVVTAFYSEEKPGAGALGIKEAPAACVIPLCLTAVGSMLLFVFPDLFIALAKLMGGAS
jgi:multicomponent Na+:H+ antiporter subunit D